MTAAVALGFQSCSDWDDHYDVNNSGTQANATLWAQISSRPELSNFAQLLKRVGYDEALNGSQSYTVWAPTNDQVDLQTYNEMSDSLLKAEFINNHVARGYHRAIGEVSEKVHLLNKKVMAFEGNGTYTIGTLPIDSANIMGKNGVMHIMSKKIDFRSNFYELFQRQSDLSTLGEIFAKKMKREIDVDNSIEGPMKDGEITYLDTVYTESNTLFTNLNAKLNNEDSTYTFLVPTNKAWETAYKKVKGYYKYPSSVQTFTVENDDKNSGKLTLTQGSTINVEADSLANEYATLQVLEPLIFSNTINPPLKNGNLPTAALDSITSTSYIKICNTINYLGGENSNFTNDAKDMFEGSEKQVTSNGYAWITDSLRVKPWNSWCPIIVLRAQNGSYQAATDNVSLASNVSVSNSDWNPVVEGYLPATSYYNVESTLGARPDVYFYVPSPYYTSYAVYLTMVPANITDTTAVPSDQKLQIRYLMHTAAGKAPSALSPSPLKTDFGSTRNLTSTTFAYGDENSSRIVTKFMGVFTPNFCYKNLPGDQKTYPVFNLRTSSSAIKGQSTVLRIAAITMVPQEVVEYYKEKGAFESYTDEMPNIFWQLNSLIY